MRDPVTEYEYPPLWVERCSDRAALSLVEQGLSVLTSSGDCLRRGFTTGTTAAAACKAAVLSLSGEVSSVDLCLPCGIMATLPVRGSGGAASAFKYAGDYRDDMTAGLEFAASAEPADCGMRVIAEAGIGRFVRDTPRYACGDPAISEPSWHSIRTAVREAMNETGIRGVVVKLSIPGGAEVGRKTLNPRVGVEGGISVLGSTGLVEPWDDHLSESVYERIAGAERVVITTGRTGLRFSRMLFPDHEVVLVGANMQKGIDAAEGDVILCGLPALILKFINPVILEGTGYKTVEEMTASPLWKEIVMKNLNEYKGRYPGVRVVIVNRKGEIEGESG